MVAIDSYIIDQQYNALPIIEHRVKESSNFNTYQTLSSTSSSSVVMITLNSPANTTTFSIREYSPSYMKLLENASWVVSFFESASELNSVKALVPYYKEINKLLNQKNFALCDTFLNQVQTNELSDVLLIGLLRLTNNWKSDLPSWSSLLANSGKELERRGHDSKALLTGLV